MEENHQEPKKNASGSTYIKTYETANIERMKSIIEELGNQGKVKRYSILVDGEVVVPVNTDIENFDRYQPFIIAGSSTLEIRMYFGKSPNFNRHIFKHKQVEPTQNLPVVQNQSTSLEGIEKLVEEKYKKQYLEQRNSFLEKKLKRSKIKLRSYKLKIEKFEEQERKRQLNSPIQNMLFQGFSAYMKNQFNIDPIPIQGITTTENDSEVEIEVEQEEVSKSDELYQALKNNYHESDVEQALKIVHTLLAKPNIATEVKSLINQKLQDHGKA